MKKAKETTHAAQVAKSLNPTSHINTGDVRLAVSQDVVNNFSYLAQALIETGTPMSAVQQNLMTGNPHSRGYEHFDEEMMGKTRTISFLQNRESPRSIWVTVRDLTNICAAAGKHVGTTGDPWIEGRLSDLLASLDKPNAMKLVPKAEKSL